MALDSAVETVELQRPQIVKPTEERSELPLTEARGAVLTPFRLRQRDVISVLAALLDSDRVDAAVHEVVDQACGCLPIAPPRLVLHGERRDRAAQERPLLFLGSDLARSDMSMCGRNLFVSPLRRCRMWSDTPQVSPCLRRCLDGAPPRADASGEAIPAGGGLPESFHGTAACRSRRRISRRLALLVGSALGKGAPPRPNRAAHLHVHATIDHKVHLVKPCGHA